MRRDLPAALALEGEAFAISAFTRVFDALWLAA
jgi:hypothetical protein